MTNREEEIIKEANEYCNGNRGSDARVRTAFLMGANYADEHPSQENIKNELIKLGYGFDLNGNIPTKEQREEHLKQYIKYQKEKLIVKAVDFLKQDLFSEELVDREETYVCSATASTIDEFIDNFKEYMED